MVFLVFRELVLVHPQNQLADFFFHLNTGRPQQGRKLLKVFGKIIDNSGVPRPTLQGKD